VTVAVTVGTGPWHGGDPAVVTEAAWSVEDLHVRDRVQVGPSFVQGDLRPRVSLVSDGGAVWFTRLGSTSIERLDPLSGSVRPVADARQPLTNLAVSPDAVWAVGEGYGEVVRMDRPTEAIGRVSLQVGGVAQAATGGIAYLDRAVWIGATGGRLLRLDLETQIVESVDVGIDVRSVTAGEGALWGVGEVGTVFRFDPRRRQVTHRAEVGAGAFRIEHGEGAVWVLDTRSAVLVQLDPDLASQRRIRVGADPYDLAVGAGAVWVTDQVGGRLVVIDPESGEIRAALEIRGRPGDVVVAGDEVWISDPDAGTLASVALR
jgi:streptogramin lyase